MMKNGRKFSAGGFILIFIIALVLPSNVLADLSGSWSVSSTAPASGCNYSGTATLTQNDLSLNVSINLAFQGSGCPAPTTMTLQLTRLLTRIAIGDNLSGSWSVNSTAPVMGCNYSGTADLTQNGLLLKGLVNLTFTGIGCPAPITLPLHFMLLSSPV
jgi:hypothetical protein